MLLSLLFGGTMAKAQIASWTFENTNAPTTVNANLTANRTVFGPSNSAVSFFGGNGGGFAYSAAGWPSSTTTLGTLQYFDFTIAPGANYAATITSIVFDVQRSATTGPATLVLRSSLDNFTNNIGSSITSVPTSFGSFTFTPASQLIAPTTITFRIYGYGASATGSNIRVDNLRINGTVDPVTVSSTNLIATGQAWKYNDKFTVQPSDWTSSTYVEPGTWLTGNSPFGYLSTSTPAYPVSTTVAATTQASGLSTIYFRKTISITSVSDYNYYILRFKRDDGLVLYVNGMEVGRDNMPTGVVALATLAPTNISPDDNFFQSIFLPNGLLKSGNNTVSIELHQRTGGDADIFLDAELVGLRINTGSLAATNIPVAANGSWKMLDNGTNQGTAWAGTTFDDTNWRTVSPAGSPLRIGYGETGDANNPSIAPVLSYTTYTATPSSKTVTPFGDVINSSYVSYGIDPANKFITTYFRKKINISNLSSYSGFDLRVMRDDGAVVYVNGVEAYRSNMPAGTPTHTTLASAAVGGAAETDFTSFSALLSPSLFVNGENTLAVEIHQDAVTSSDITFNLTLNGIQPQPPVAPVGGIPNQVATVGQSFSYTVPAFTDPENQTLAYTASGLSGNFTFDAVTRVIAGTPTSQVGSPLSVTIIATDPTNLTTAASFVLTISAQPNQPPVAPASLAPASTTLGAAFSYTVTGFTDPENLALTYTANGLPAGLNISPTGVISGTATVFAGSPYSVTITATDPGPLSATAVLTLTVSNTVNYAPVAPTIPNQTGTAFRGFTYIVPAFTDANLGQTLTYAATGLPTGLSFNPSTRVISGLLGSTTGSPFSITATATDPEGLSTNGIVMITVSPSSCTNLVCFGDMWRYLDNGTDQGTAWSATGFDASAWAYGPAPLGYRGTTTNPYAISTTVGFGPSSTNKYITTYFRKTFTASAGLYSATLNLRVDDGAVVYLNGTEIARTSNIPAGTVLFSTTATSTAASDGGTTQSFTVNPGLLVNGDNVLAVEVHQQAVTSSDIFLDVELTSLATAPQAVLVRGPYLQNGTPSQMVIRWRTNIANIGQVNYGTSAGALTSSASETAATTEHVVLVSGLSANTQYFYSVGTSATALEGAANNYFYTFPTAGTNKKTRIWSLGDFGIGTAGGGFTALRQANVKNAFNSYVQSIGDPYIDLWVWLGDNVYQTGTDQEYTDYVFSRDATNRPYAYGSDKYIRQTPIYPVPGNHDYANTTATRTPDANGNFSIPYTNMISPPINGEAGGVASGKKQYYSFNYNNIHFVMLDSWGYERDGSGNLITTILSPTGPQVTWMKADLAAAQTDPNIKWTVLVWHHPPYTRSAVNSDTDAELINIRQNFLPVLEQYKVDLVMSGHSHVYERSRLLKGFLGTGATYVAATHNPADGSNAQSTGKFNGATNSAYYFKDRNATTNEGTVYMVNGSGGAEHTTTATTFPHPAMNGGSQDDPGLSVYLEVDGGRMDVKTISATSDLAGATGFAIVDQFTMIKDVSSLTFPASPVTTLTATAEATDAAGNTYYTDKDLNVLTMVRKNGINLGKADDGTFKMQLKGATGVTQVSPAANYVTLPGGWQVLNRHVTVTPTAEPTSGSVTVSFFYTQADVDAINTALGQTLTPAQLKVFKINDVSSNFDGNPVNGHTSVTRATSFSSNGGWVFDYSAAEPSPTTWKNVDLGGGRYRADFVAGHFGTFGIGGAVNGANPMNVNPGATLTVSNNATITCGQPTLTLTATATATTGSFTFAFGGSGITASSPTAGTATLNIAGVYSVTVTDIATGLTSTTTTTVYSDTATPTATLSPTSATFTCASASLTLMAGTGTGYSYTFSAGATQIGTSNVATVSTAGTYTVTVGTTNGCTAAATANIASDTASPTITLTVSNSLNCTSQTATLTATSIPGATYQFSAGALQTGTSNLATVSAGGTYTVTVSGENGCTALETATVQQNTTQPTATLTSSNSLNCAVTSATLTAAVGTGYSYSFSAGATQIGTSNLATVSAAGSYSVTVTDLNGCTALATTNITSITTAPTATLAASNSLNCSVQSATLTAETGAGYSYQFSLGAIQRGSSNIATVGSPGSYSVTVTDANGCTALAITSVTSDTAAPTATLAASNSLNCTLTSATITAGMGAGYSYQFSAGATQIGTSNMAEVIAGGTYSVTVSANGCTAINSVVVSQSNTSPSVSLTSGTLVCGQPTVMLTASGGTSYSFSTGQTGATNTITVSAAGTYSVLVTDANGCTALATTTVISDTVAPTATLTASNSLNCGTTSATLTAGTGVGYSYLFSVGATQIGTSNLATISTGGIFSVIVSSANGCTALATATVQSNAVVPTATLVSSNSLNCTLTSATLTAGTGTDYTYQFSAGATQIGTTNQAEVIVGGAYSVTVSANGCASTTSIAVSQNNTPPSASLTSGTLVCGQTSLILTASGGTSYSFSTGQAGATNTITASTTGTYSVLVTNANGCTATATGTVSGDNALPTATLTASGSVGCGAAASVTLTATGGTSYSLNTGVVNTTGQFVVSVARAYSVLVTGANGCTALATTTVANNTAAPALTLVPSGTITCANATVSLAATSGLASYTFVGVSIVSQDQALGTAIVNRGGSYSVTATGLNSCTARVGTTVVSATASPAASLTVSNSLGTLTSATLTATSSPTFTYQFSAGATQIGSTNQATVSLIGTYTVTVTNTNGCTIAATANVISNTAAPGLVWSYFDKGVRPPSQVISSPIAATLAWYQPDFTEPTSGTATWLQGASPLGYDETNNYPIYTTVGFGGTSANKGITTYFRRVFNVPNLDQNYRVKVRYRKDDGISIYVNGVVQPSLLASAVRAGVEVRRDGIVSTAVLTAATSSSILASTTIGTDATWYEFYLPNGAIRPGNNLIAAEVHQSTADSPDQFFDFELIPESNPNTLVSQPLPVTSVAATNWKYWDAGVSLDGTTWKTVGFDDQYWQQTNVGTRVRMGFGETGDPNTNSAPAVTSTNPLRCNTYTNYVSFGLESTNKFPTYYFRKKINIPDVTAYSGYNFRVMRDDAVGVFINGQEVFRNNFEAALLTTDPITSTVLALSTVDGTEETSYLPGIYTGNQATYYPLSASLLQNGDNIVAIEVHQRGGYPISSSDMTFNFELYGIPNTPIAPVASAPGSRTTGIGQVFSYTLAAFTDANNQTLTYAATGIPAGFVFDGTTRILSGSVTNATLAGSPYSVTFTATDPDNLTAATTLTLTVLPPSGPVATTIANQTAVATQPFTVVLPAFADANGDPLTYTATGLPMGFTLNATTRVLAGTAANQTGSPFSVTVTATDPTGLTASTSFTLTINPAPAPTLLRGPYLQNATSSQMVVRWRTNIFTVGRVQYGTSAGNLNMVVDEPTSFTDHVVSLTGLSPNTQYYYSIGTSATVLEGTAVNLFRTFPTEGTNKKVRIWSLGDFGIGSTRQANVKNQMKNYIASQGDPYIDLFLWMGDNAYQSGTDAEFQNFVFDRDPADASAYGYEKIMKQTPIYPTPGNHDYGNGSSARRQDLQIPYYDIMTLPTKAEAGGVPSNTESYYSFNYGQIHFVSLDSDRFDEGSASTRFDNTKAQITWLKLDLAAAQANPNIKWIIAFWHHPPYSKGTHDADTDSQLTQVRQNLLPVLEQYKVDLVMNGHSHVYERSRLQKNLYGISTTYNASVNNPEDGSNAKSSGKMDGSANSCYYFKSRTSTGNEGTIYMVNGHGGASGGNQGAAFPMPLAATSYDQTDGGSVYLEIEGGVLTAKMIAGSNGAVIDQFTIVKDVDSFTVPATSATSRTATCECTDKTDNQTYYTDNSLNRLLSVKKNGVNIGRVGDGTFTMQLNGAPGASLIAANAPANYVSLPTGWYGANRHFVLNPTTEPAAGSTVSVSFYYTQADVDAINAGLGQTLTPSQLEVFKINDVSTPFNAAPTSGHTNIPLASSFAANGAWIYDSQHHTMAKHDNGRGCLSGRFCGWAFWRGRHWRSFEWCKPNCFIARRKTHSQQ
jgi:predicted MPP superfamily phosphohydrolase